MGSPSATDIRSFGSDSEVGDVTDTGQRFTTKAIGSN